MLVEIYTDGSCTHDGRGGWAALLMCNGKELEVWGCALNSTNNLMELEAAIQGLAALKAPAEVKLMSDSTYVTKGINEWVAGWKARGWKLASGAPVKNVESWKRLEIILGEHDVTAEWVRGHSGVPGNERVDALACQAGELQITNLEV